LCSSFTWSYNLKKVIQFFWEYLIKYINYFLICSDLMYTLCIH